MRKQAVIARKGSFPIEVTKGKTYYWCACGRSKNQPLCDGSHQGTDFEPLPFTAPKSETVYLCGCKRSSERPMCDGTHQSL